METLRPTYIGREICIKSLKDYILDTKLGTGSTIYLHPYNFDDIVFEFRKTYGESINLPYVLLGVQIKEDTNHRTPMDRVAADVVPQGTYPDDFYTEQAEIVETHYGEEVHRCGWCGNIVDLDGSELDTKTRSYKIHLLEKHRDEITVRHIDGYCCKDEIRKMYERVGK